MAGITLATEAFIIVVSEEMRDGTPLGLSIKRRVGEVTFRVFPFSGLVSLGRRGVLRGLPRRGRGRGRWEVEEGGGSISSTLLTEKTTSSMWGEVDVGMSGVAGGSDFGFLPRFRLFTPAIDESFEVFSR